MTNIIDQVEKEEVERLAKNKTIPDFKPGDTIRVGSYIVEGTNQRVQYIEGACIAKSNNSINSSFVVRKISSNIGVERKFPLYSPIIESITVVKRGIVRRAKLYYLRDRIGKAARIAERKEFNKKPKENSKK